MKANTTEGEVLHTTAITEAVFGVALQTVSTGQAVPVETGNGAIVKLTASAAISVGDRLMPGANGRWRLRLAPRPSTAAWPSRRLAPTGNHHRAAQPDGQVARQHLIRGHAHVQPGNPPHPHPVERLLFDFMVDQTQFLAPYLFDPKMVDTATKKVPQSDTSRLRVPNTLSKTNARAQKIDEQFFYRDIDLEEHKLAADINPHEVSNSDNPMLVDEARKSKIVTLGLLMQASRWQPRWPPRRPTTTRR